MFCKKGVLKNFAEFIGKQLCQSPFFNKVAGLRPETLVRKRLLRRCFPVNFTKILRTSFLQNTFWRLLLVICQCYQQEPTLTNYLPDHYRIIAEPTLHTDHAYSTLKRRENTLEIHVVCL